MDEVITYLMRRLSEAKLLQECIMRPIERTFIPTKVEFNKDTLTYNFAGINYTIVFGENRSVHLSFVIRSHITVDMAIGLDKAGCELVESYLYPANTKAAVNLIIKAVSEYYPNQTTKESSND